MRTLVLFWLLVVAVAVFSGLALLVSAGGTDYSIIKSTDRGIVEHRILANNYVFQLKGDTRVQTDWTVYIHGNAQVPIGQSWELLDQEYINTTICEGGSFENDFMDCIQKTIIIPRSYRTYRQNVTFSAGFFYRTIEIDNHGRGKETAYWSGPNASLEWNAIMTGSAFSKNAKRVSDGEVYAGWTDAPTPISESFSQGRVRVRWQEGLHTIDPDVGITPLGLEGAAFYCTANSTTNALSPGGPITPVIDQGMTYINGFFVAQSFNFSNVTRVNLSYSNSTALALGNDKTFEFVINSTQPSTDASPQFIIGFANLSDTNNWQVLQIFEWDGNLSIFYRNATTSLLVNTLMCAHCITKGVPQYFAITDDRVNGNMSVYHNGTLAGSALYAPQSFPLTGFMTLGRQNDSSRIGTKYLNAQIDEFRYTKTVLPTANFSTFYNCNYNATNSCGETGALVLSVSTPVFNQTNYTIHDSSIKANVTYTSSNGTASNVTAFWFNASSLLWNETRLEVANGTTLSFNLSMTNVTVNNTIMMYVNASQGTNYSTTTSASTNVYDFTPGITALLFNQSVFEWNNGFAQGLNFTINTSMISAAFSLFFNVSYNFNGILNSSYWNETNITTTNNVNTSHVPAYPTDYSTGLLPSLNWTNGIPGVYNQMNRTDSGFAANNTPGTGTANAFLNRTTYSSFPISENDEYIMYAPCGYTLKSIISSCRVGLFNDTGYRLATAVLSNSSGTCSGNNPCIALEINQTIVQVSSVTWENDSGDQTATRCIKLTYNGTTHVINASTSTQRALCSNASGYGQSLGFTSTLIDTPSTIGFLMGGTAYSAYVHFYAIEHYNLTVRTKNYATSNAFASSNPLPGDNVTAILTINDSNAQSWGNKSNVSRIMTNKPPVLSAVNKNQTNYTTMQNLRVNLTTNDPEGYAQNVTMTLLKNNAVVETRINASIANNTVVFQTFSLAGYAQNDNVTVLANLTDLTRVNQNTSGTINVSALVVAGAVVIIDDGCKPQPSNRNAVIMCNVSITNTTTIDTVYANYTMPNGVVIQINITTNGNRSNFTTSNTSFFERYNTSWFVNQTDGGFATFTTQFFTLNDSQKPHVYATPTNNTLVIVMSNTSQRFNVSVTDDDVVNTTEWFLNLSVGGVEASVGVTLDYNFSNETVGNYSLKLVAIDAYGNNASSNWTVNNVNNTIIIFDKGCVPGVGNLSQAVTCSIEVYNTSGIDTVYGNYSMPDGVVLVGWASSGNSSWITTSDTGLYGTYGTLWFVNQTTGVSATLSQSFSITDVLYPFMNSSPANNTLVVKNRGENVSLVTTCKDNHAGMNLTWSMNGSVVRTVNGSGTNVSSDSLIVSGIGVMVVRENASVVCTDDYGLMAGQNWTIAFIDNMSVSDFKTNDSSIGIDSGFAVNLTYHHASNVSGIANFTFYDFSGNVLFRTNSSALYDGSVGIGVLPNSSMTVDPAIQACGNVTDDVNTSVTLCANVSVTSVQAVLSGVQSDTGVPYCPGARITFSASYLNEEVFENVTVFSDCGVKGGNLFVGGLVLSGGTPNVSCIFGDGQVGSTDVLFILRDSRHLNDSSSNLTTRLGIAFPPCNSQGQHADLTSLVPVNSDAYPFAIGPQTAVTGVPVNESIDSQLRLAFPISSGDTLSKVIIMIVVFLALALGAAGLRLPLILVIVLPVLGMVVMVGIDVIDGLTSFAWAAVLLVVSMGCGWLMHKMLGGGGLDDA